MKDRTLLNWVRIALVVSAVMQVFFGFRLLFDPGSITEMWPWPMTPITARLLGASTLVSVPLALLSVWFHRFSSARLPMIMVLTYRVLQLAAGFIHFDRFDLGSPTTWNYFGGGGIILFALLFSLVRGPVLGDEALGAHPFLRGDAKLKMSATGKSIFRAVSILFILLGAIFFALGAKAGWLWFEQDGNLTNLTARLFASPMIGLGLAAWIITTCSYWKQVGIPAVGMSTFGVAGVITIFLESASIQPPTEFGYIVVAAPILLLGMGVYLLLPARSSA